MMHHCAGMSRCVITRESLLWHHSYEEPIRPEMLIRAQNGNNSAKKEKVLHGRSVYCEDQRTAFVALLRSCAKNKDLRTGTKLHQDILERGLIVDCSDALVTMYAKCGVLSEAKELLYRHKSRDVISWTSLIAGYVRHGYNHDALNCFKRMKLEGLSPDAVTFSSILKACGSLRAADMGTHIHEEISRLGLLGNDVVLGTALIDMYVKCGALAKAECVLEELPFRNVVSWSALIAGYSQQGQAHRALDCFENMQHEGLSPDAVTLACILKACGSIGALDKGVQIHDEVVRKGLLRNSVVLGTALMDMYIKCGELDKAQQVIEELPFRDIVTWSALIAGHAQQGQAEKALHCFELMQQEGLLPDAVAFSCILKACGAVGAVDKGKQIHDQISELGLIDDRVLATALVDMYAKCGALTRAQQVLEKLPTRDLISWSALIAGYAKQGQAEQVLHCFKRMQQEGVHPDEVTFACVLSACNHLGLEEDGYLYFVEMGTKYGLKPTLEHFTCMIDLFGRSGHLDKAVGVIQEMPSNHSAVWLVLLGACQKWVDVDVGRWAFERAIELDRSNGAPYVLMTNIYAAAGMEEDVAVIEAMRKVNKARKKPELSWWADINEIPHAVFGG